MAPVAVALQAMRGVALVVAVTVVAEVGDRLLKKSEFAR
jgi:hypothetical protein